MAPTNPLHRTAWHWPFAWRTEDSGGEVAAENDASDGGGVDGDGNDDSAQQDQDNREPDQDQDQEMYDSQAGSSSCQPMEVSSGTAWEGRPSGTPKVIQSFSSLHATSVVDGLRTWNSSTWQGCKGMIYEYVREGVPRFRCPPQHLPPPFPH